MLYVIATPIGNLDDITLRALEALKSADVIAAEDTRHSGNLLRHFEIRKPLISYHEHNEAMRAEQLVERLAAGENVALITDAGMPGLSDPGSSPDQKMYRTRAAFHVRARRFRDSDRVGWFGNFDGTLLFPRISAGEKWSARARIARGGGAGGDLHLLRVAVSNLKTLAACTEIMPDRQLCVARELTKKFEEFRRGTAAELLAHYTAHPAKGEITLVVSGAD